MVVGSSAKAKFPWVSSRTIAVGTPKGNPPPSLPSVARRAGVLHDLRSFPEIRKAPVMLRPVRVCRRTGASVTVLLPALLAAGPVFAQYEVEQPSPVWVRALIDARVVRGSQPPSWTDSGPGKLRYGGRLTENGFERVTRAELAQLVLE